MPARFKHDYGWPHNFVADILDSDEVYKNPPADFKETIDFILCRLEELNKEWYDAFILRYRDHLKYEEIGKIINRSSTDAQYRVSNCCRLASHEITKDFLKYGLAKASEEHLKFDSELLPDYENDEVSRKILKILKDTLRIYLLEDLSKLHFYEIVNAFPRENYWLSPKIHYDYNHDFSNIKEIFDRIIRVLDKYEYDTSELKFWYDQTFNF